MKRLNFAAALLSLMLIAATGTAQTNYSRVTIYADDARMEQLHDLGICIDHGTMKKGHSVTTDLSSDEIATLAANGYQYEIEIADVVTYYQQRNANPELKNGAERGGGACGGSGGSISYPQPSNFSLGSMGGFHTYSEYFGHIDQMAQLYPNLITVKQGISNFMTHENRPIYYVKISDNPGTDEAEPEVLYTALIHAREPAAGAQLIYYMWYLLENYATNPEVQYLVDNTEMYFVPMINPDGYVYNETNSPNGGGMWRKNRRNNGGGDYGVDLNRNFSYQWSVSGSSNNPGNDTYHGPNAFSEPETQAIKWFCENRDFKLALNYHTYGDLLLFPFGYAAIQTPDFNLQNIHSGHMVSQNTASNILSADLYPAAGDSDDWMYAGDLGTKPKIFAYTPEVGNDNQGFWPSVNDIIPLCEAQVFQNLSASWLVNHFAVATDAHPATEMSLTPYLKYDVQRMGLLDGGTYTVSIDPISGFQSVGTANTYTFTNVLDVESDSIAVILDPTLVAGQTFTYALTLSNGSYTWSDTISKTFGGGSVIFADNANNTNNWTGGWNAVTNQYYSAPASIHDSPNGNYSNNANDVTTLNQTIDLTNALSANLSFYARWEIEAGWDYVQVRASSNGGGSWTALCGKYTVEGNSNQDQGNPLYDGIQTDWVKEEISLNDYLGQTIQLQFRLISDGAVRDDGFYFDDVEVSVVMVSSIDEIAEAGAQLGDAMPNPATAYTYLPYTLPAGVHSATMEVYDATGKLVATAPVTGQTPQLRLNTTALDGGVYLYRIRTDNAVTPSKRLVIVK